VVFDTAGFRRGAEKALAVAANFRAGRSQRWENLAFDGADKDGRARRPGSNIGRCFKTIALFPHHGPLRKHSPMD